MSRPDLETLKLTCDTALTALHKKVRDHDASHPLLKKIGTATKELDLLQDGVSVSPLRKSLLTILADSEALDVEPESDGLHGALLTLTAYNPSESSDLESYAETIDEAKLVRVSTGHELNIAFFFKCHEVRTPLTKSDETVAEKTLINPHTNQPFSHRDEAHLLAVAKEKNITVTCVMPKPFCKEEIATLPPSIRVIMRDTNHQAAIRTLHKTGLTLETLRLVNPTILDDLLRNAKYLASDEQSSLCYLIGEAIKKGIDITSYQTIIKDLTALPKDDLNRSMLLIDFQTLVENPQPAHPQTPQPETEVFVVYAEPQQPVHNRQQAVPPRDPSPRLSENAKVLLAKLSIELKKQRKERKTFWGSRSNRTKAIIELLEAAVKAIRTSDKSPLVNFNQPQKKLALKPSGCCCFQDNSIFTLYTDVLRELSSAAIVPQALPTDVIMRIAATV